MMGFVEGNFRREDYLCMLDLKGGYFSVPWNKDSQKFVWFKQKDTLYKFLYIFFGLDSEWRLFTKLLRVPITTLRKLNNLLRQFSNSKENHERSDKEQGQCHLSFKTSQLFFFFLYIQFTLFKIKSLQSPGTYTSKRTWDPNQKAITK